MVLPAEYLRAQRAAPISFVLSLRTRLLVSNSHPPNPSVLLTYRSIFMFRGSELASWASIPDNRGSPDITVRWCLWFSNTCIPGTRANICDRLDWSLGTRSRHTCLSLTIRRAVHRCVSNISPLYLRFSSACKARMFLKRIPVVAVAVSAMVCSWLALGISRHGHN